MVPLPKWDLQLHTVPRNAGLRERSLWQVLPSLGIIMIVGDHVFHGNDFRKQPLKGKTLGPAVRLSWISGLVLPVHDF